MFTDIPQRDWVSRKVPQQLRPYARLMRLDRPIGTWLLLLPCWWGIALACPGMPNLWLMFLFAVAAVIMRGAGCVVNDLYDRDLDRQVERTLTRPLASGEVRPWQAMVLITILLALGLGILLLLKRNAVLIGAASLLLVFTYPLMKRITWWPQLFLGFTFNWGALVGWVAVTGTLASPAIWLYSAGIFWTLAYDTVYAHQDAADDARIGIKSTALLFGQRSKRWVGGFYVLAILGLLCGGHAAALKLGFYLLMIWAASFTYGQWSLWRLNSPQNCLKRFHSSRDFGWIVLLAIIAGKFL